MKRKSTNAGLTLLEIVIACAILALLAVLAFSMSMGTLRRVATEDTVTVKDANANRIIQAITLITRQAILPASIERGGSENKTSGLVFEDIDSATVGFGGRIGKKWGERLGEGMDSIAFIVPIDAQGVGDFLDDAGRLQTGQARPDGINTLGSVPMGTPNSGSDFLARDPGSPDPVNALAAVDPDKFDSLAAESVLSPDNWKNLVGDASARWPEITCFTAIRYLPRLAPDGSPVVIREQGLGPNGNDLDLDGDDAVDGEFHIGRLQVLYTGGRLPRVQGTSVVWEDLPQITTNLCSDIVLRKVERSRRTPIFRLVKYESGNLSGAGGAGHAEEGKAGGIALAIRLLIVDSRTMVGSELRFNPHSMSQDARWYETRLVLRNMTR